MFRSLDGSHTENLNALHEECAHTPFQSLVYKSTHAQSLLSQHSVFSPSLTLSFAPQVPQEIHIPQSTPVLKIKDNDDIKKIQAHLLTYANSTSSADMADKCSLAMEVLTIASHVEEAIYSGEYLSETGTHHSMAIQCSMEQSQSLKTDLLEFFDQEDHQYSEEELKDLLESLIESCLSLSSAGLSADMEFRTKAHYGHPECLDLIAEVLSTYLSGRFYLSEHSEESLTLLFGEINEMAKNSYLITSGQTRLTSALLTQLEIDCISQLTKPSDQNQDIYHQALTEIEGSGDGRGLKEQRDNEEAKVKEVDRCLRALYGQAESKGVTHLKVVLALYGGSNKSLPVLLRDITRYLQEQQIDAEHFPFFLGEVQTGISGVDGLLDKLSEASHSLDDTLLVASFIINHMPVSEDLSIEEQQKERDEIARYYLMRSLPDHLPSSTQNKPKKKRKHRKSRHSSKQKKSRRHDSRLGGSYIDRLLEESRDLINTKKQESSRGFLSYVSSYFTGEQGNSHIVITHTEKLVALLKLSQLCEEMQSSYNHDLTVDSGFLESSDTEFYYLQQAWTEIEVMMTKACESSDIEVEEELKQSLISVMRTSFMTHCLSQDLENSERIYAALEAMSEYCCEHTLADVVYFYQHWMSCFKSKTTDQSIMSLLEDGLKHFDLNIDNFLLSHEPKTRLSYLVENLTRALYVSEQLKDIARPFIPAVQSYQNRLIPSSDTRVSVYDSDNRAEIIKEYVEKHLQEVFVYYQGSLGEIKEEISVNISPEASWQQIVSDVMRTKAWLMSSESLCLDKTPDLKYLNVSFKSSHQSTHCPESTSTKLMRACAYIDSWLQFPSAAASDIPDSTESQKTPEEEEAAVTSEASITQSDTTMIPRTADVSSTSELERQSYYSTVTEAIRTKDTRNNAISSGEDKSLTKKRKKRSRRHRRDTILKRYKRVKDVDMEFDPYDKTLLARIVHDFGNEDSARLNLEKMQKVSKLALEKGKHHPLFLSEYDQYMQEHIGRSSSGPFVVEPSSNEMDAFQRATLALYMEKPEFRDLYTEVFSKRLNEGNYPYFSDLKKLGFSHRMMDDLFYNQASVKYALEFCESVNLLTGKEIYNFKDLYEVRLNHLARKRIDVYKLFSEQYKEIKSVWRQQVTTHPKWNELAVKYPAKAFSQLKLMETRIFTSEASTAGHCYFLSMLTSYASEKEGIEGIVKAQQIFSEMQNQVHAKVDPLFLDKQMPILRDMNLILNQENRLGNVHGNEKLFLKQDLVNELDNLLPNKPLITSFNNHATMMYIDTVTRGVGNPIYVLFDPNFGMYPCFSKDHFSDVWNHLRIKYGGEVTIPSGSLEQLIDIPGNMVKIAEINPDAYKMPFSVRDPDGSIRQTSFVDIAENIIDIREPLPIRHEPDLDSLMRRWRSHFPNEEMKIKKPKKIEMPSFMKKAQHSIIANSNIVDDMNQNVVLTKYTKMLDGEISYELNLKGIDTPDEALVKIDHFFNADGDPSLPTTHVRDAKVKFEVDVLNGLPGQRITVNVEIDESKVRNFLRAVKSSFSKSTIKRTVGRAGSVGVALMPFIALLQIASIQEKMKSDNQLDRISGRIEAGILTADMAVGIAQTASMVSASLPKITSVAKVVNLAKYAGSVGKYLGPAGAGLGVLAGGAEVGVGAYRMSTAENDYQYEVGKLEVAHGSVTVILSVMMAIPCPPCQAAAIAAQLIAELIFHYLRAELEQKLEDYNNTRDMCRYERLMQEILASVKTLITETEKTYNLDIPLAVSSVSIEGTNLKIQLSSNAITTDISTSVDNKRCTAKFGSFSVVNCLKESHTLPEDLSFDNDHYDPKNIIILPSTPTVNFSLRESIAYTTNMQAWNFEGLSKLQQCWNEQHFNRKTPGASAEGCDVMERPVLRYKYDGENSKKSPVTETVISTRPGISHTIITEEVVRYSLPTTVRLESQNTTINLGSGSEQALFSIPTGLEKPMAIYGSSQYRVMNSDPFYPKPHYLFQSQEKQSAVSILLNPGAVVDFTGVQGAKVISLFENSPGSIYKVEFISKTVCRIYMHAINKHPGGDQPIEKTDDSTTGAYWWIPNHPICDQVHDPNEQKNSQSSRGKSKLLEYTDIDIGSSGTREVYLTLLRGPGINTIPMVTFKLHFNQQKLYVASLGNNQPDTLLMLGSTSYIEETIPKHIGSIPFWIDNNSLVGSSYNLEEDSISMRGFIRYNPLSSKQSKIIVPFVCKKSLLEEKGNEYINSFTLAKVVLTVDPKFDNLCKVLKIDSGQVKMGLFLFYSEENQKMVWQIDDHAVSLDSLIECTTELKEKTLLSGQIDYSCNDVYTFNDESQVGADRLHIAEHEDVAAKEDWLSSAIVLSEQHRDKVSEPRKKRSLEDSTQSIFEDLFEISSIPVHGEEVKLTLHHGKAYLRPRTTHEESIVGFVSIQGREVAIVAEKIPESVLVTTPSTTISQDMSDNSTQTPLIIKTKPDHIKFFLLNSYTDDLKSLEEAVYKQTLSIADIPVKQSWLDHMSIEAYEVSSENQSLIVKTAEGLILQCFIDPNITGSGIRLNAISDTWFENQKVSIENTEKISSLVQFLLSQYKVDEQQRFLPVHLQANSATQGDIFYIRGGYQRTLWKDLTSGKEMILEWSESESTLGSGPRQHQIIGYTYNTEGIVLSATVQAAEMNRLFLLSRNAETGRLSIVEELNCANSVMLEENGESVLTCLLSKSKPTDPSKVTLPPYSGIDKVHFIPVTVALDPLEVFIEPKTWVVIPEVILGKPTNILQKPQKISLPSATEEESLGMPRVMVSLGKKNEALSSVDQTLYDISVDLLLPKDDDIGQLQYAHLVLAGAYNGDNVDPFFKELSIRYGDLEIDYQYIADKISVLSKSEYCSLSAVEQCNSGEAQVAQVLDV